ncbi:hypothetical protein ALP59_102506 [Pseudomonas savastanoi]|uniref:Uncharacterized protein n=1 Tax=Pseudomonas savastanoi TaxID=29438 RepID=A0A3M5GB39_PSESS|nr:hypothetical protein ALP59_102506 [Pseudomonas savastanoi]
MTPRGVLAVSGKVKVKTSPYLLEAPNDGTFSVTDLPPEIVCLTVDKVGKTACKARGVWLGLSWLFFVQIHWVVASTCR